MGSHHADVGLSRVPPHERLLNGQFTSVRWRFAFVLNEPIRCYVNVDTSVVCQALIHCLGSFILQDFCFRGANVENKNFSLKCCLLAFYIVVLGPAI